jgi:gliding motility-associatede transport system auxiliary component
MRGSRAALGWTQLGIQVVLLLVVLGLLQVVADRSNRRFDLTGTGSLSLSPVVRKVLGDVEGPLAITVFYRRGSRAQYAGLLGRLQAENPHVTFQLYDLDRYPERARGMGVTEYGRAAVEYGGRRTVVPALPEEQLVGGILRVLRGKALRVVFTGGHGERTPAGGQESYGALSAALDAENYVVEGVSLLDGPVPPDTDVLIVAGPAHDFLLEELDRVAEFLRGGGGVVMLLEPGPLPNLTRFLASLGLVIADDFIVDRDRRILGTDGLAAVVELFKRGNPVTDPSDRPVETGVVLPSARSVDVAGEVPGVAAESVARTSPSAWTMAGPARARRGEEPSEAAHDTHGSASVVVMAEVGAGGDGAERRAGRLVVVGDADFASDAYLDVLGNRDLVLNAVAWAAGEASLSSVRPKRVAEVLKPLSPLVLTAPRARLVFVGCVVLPPALVLAAGLIVVGLRRRRG